MQKNKFDELFSSCSDSLVNHEKELRETLKGVGAISAAIATGALVLLSADLKVNESFLLSGLVFLLFATVGSVIYVLHNNIKSIRLYNNAFREFLIPLSEFFSDLEKSENENSKPPSSEKLDKIIKFRLPEERHNKKFLMEIFVITLLVLGILMVVAGMTIEHLSHGHLSRLLTSWNF